VSTKAKESGAIKLPAQGASVPPADQRGRPTPSGVERTVRADELFFSTTDRRGVIRSSNSVFTRISGYGSKELIGTPHNIVRHPEMPSGAFALMWDRLLSGQAMAAYVLNLARDGRHYWVFASITPLGEGFLSVRMAPMTGILPIIWQLYRQVLVKEVRLRQGGAGRAEAAAAGAELILAGVAGLGFRDYDAFMATALPAEVAARDGLVTQHWARPSAVGPTAEILHGAVILDDHLGALVARLDRYRELADALDASSTSVLETARQLDAATSAARIVSASAISTAPVLHTVAVAMSRPSGQTVETLRAAVEDLAVLRTQLTDSRWRIALARSHNDMVAAFAAEVIDGGAPPSALADVPVLCDALADGVETMASTVGRMNLHLAHVAASLERAGELFDDVRRFIGKWRLLLLRQRVSGTPAGSVGPIDAMLHDGHDRSAELRELAGRCSAEIVAMDVTTIETALDRIRHAVRALHLD